MLSEGKSITAIAYEVGYENPSAFTAMFHRALGVRADPIRPAGGEWPVGGRR